MKCYSIYSLVAAAAVASAQSIASLPGCAAPCIGNFSSGSKFAGCSQLDVACICANSSFISDIACCLTEQCDDADQKLALNYAKEICSSAGVTVPDAVVCNETTSAAPSGSATPTETGSASDTGSTATPTASGGSKNSTESASASKTTTGAANQPTTNAGAVLAATNLLGAAAAVLMLAL